MSRGRKPQPTKLKIMRGNPGKRPLPKGEPQPTPGAPPCPRWLSKDAKAEWKRIAPELERLQLLTVADLAALAGYCQAWAELQDATRTLDKEGRIIDVPITSRRRVAGEVTETVIGYKKSLHPAVKLQRDAFARVKAFLCEFGLSPATRPKVAGQGGPAPAASPAAKYLGTA